MRKLESRLLEIIDQLEIAHIHKDDWRFGAEIGEARKRLSELLLHDDDWLPYHTAPKTGIRVDLWGTVGDGQGRYADCVWDGSDRKWHCGAADVFVDPRQAKITHWRPLVGPLAK